MGGSSDLQRGFSCGRLFRLCSHGLAACSLPLPPSSVCQGWHWGERQCLPPLLLPLNPIPCQPQPERYVLWRMWSWVSVPLSCILLCRLALIWAPLREYGSVSSDPRSVWLSRVPLLSASQAGSRDVCVQPLRRQGQRQGPFSFCFDSRFIKAGRQDGLGPCSQGVSHLLGKPDVE